ncbi:gamma-glutamyltransferase, partial [Pantoea sp. SIMBA_079]
VCATIRTVAPLFAEHWPTSAEHWMPGGRIPEPGELITNPAYARVLRGLIGAGDAAATREERIEAARREWATGTVAQAASAFVRTPH